MQCSFCGSPLTTAMRFCPFCGTKIMTTRGLRPEPPAAPSLSPPVWPVDRPPTQDGVKPPKRRRWWAWLLALLTLGLLTLLLLWLLNTGV